MPKPDKSKRPFNARKLHQELLAVGLKVISVNSRGEVVLDNDPSPEQIATIQSVKQKHTLEANFRSGADLR